MISAVEASSGKPSIYASKIGPSPWAGKQGFFSKNTLVTVLIITHVVAAIFNFLGGYWFAAALNLGTALFENYMRIELNKYADMRTETLYYSRENAQHSMENIKLRVERKHLHKDLIFFDGRLQELTKEREMFHEENNTYKHLNQNHEAKIKELEAVKEALEVKFLEIAAGYEKQIKALSGLDKKFASHAKDFGERILSLSDFETRFTKEQKEIARDMVSFGAAMSFSLEDFERQRQDLQSLLEIYHTAISKAERELENLYRQNDKSSKLNIATSQILQEQVIQAPKDILNTVSQGLEEQTNRQSEALINVVGNYLKGLFPFLGSKSAPPLDERVTVIPLSA